MKVVIVGGVAGGATAAARLRRLDENAEIIIIERTHYVSYANCGLPYYIGGTITDRKKLTLQTPESFRSRFNIDVRVDQEVLHIDRDAQQVEIRNLVSGETYSETYDKLILSPGAHPVMPNLPGIHSSRIYTLRTVEDTFAIADYLEKLQAEQANRPLATPKPLRATVVGGGFIGLEMAENLVDRGVDVAVLQRPNHLMHSLDPDIASLLHNRMREAGITLKLGADVASFSENANEITTSFKNKGDETGISNQTIASDIVILAIGVTPESTLAKDAGLELGIKGAIKVNEHLLTSDPHIYAIGDAIETTQVVSGQPAHIALAGPANKQGRIVADHICGISRTFAGSMGSSVMKAFDLTVATTGLSTKAATSAGINFDSIIITPASHATYYPGAHTMTMKVLFERPSGRILGAQIIGGEGVDKRIDVLAVAIKAGMTAFDLAEIDLAYAPPYASAKDPVNMAGYVIENILEGTVEQIHWDKALTRANSDDGTVILDTRTQAEFDRGHIGSNKSCGEDTIHPVIHIPVDELRERLEELPHDKKLFVHCATGIRSYIACRILSQHGFTCANIAGGYNFYQALKLDHNVETKNVGDCGLIESI